MQVIEDVAAEILCYWGIWTHDPSSKASMMAQGLKVDWGK